MGRKPIKVEVVIFRFVNGSYEYLLLKRIASRGGFWQPVTGGLEEGEELHDAIVREVREETGIARIKRIINDVHQFTLEDKKHFTEYVFGAEINADEKITFDKNIYEEHDAHRWCSFDKAMQMLKWDGNKTGLRKLHKLLEEE